MKYKNFNYLKFSKFRKQLSFFKKNFQIISADEMIYFLQFKEKLKKTNRTEAPVRDAPRCLTPELKKKAPFF